MSESQLSFTVKRTKADYFWAVAFNALKSPIIPIFFAFALLLVLGPNALEGELYATDFMLVGAIYAALIVLYYLFLMAAVWFGARKNWSSPGALEPLSYTFSAEGIAASYAMGQGQMAWPLWTGAIETKALVLIRHSLGMLHIIPKRDLDAATLARLRALLRDRFGSKAQLRG